MRYSEMSNFLLIFAHYKTLYSYFHFVYLLLTIHAQRKSRLYTPEIMKVLKEPCVLFFSEIHPALGVPAPRGRQ